jgi:LMBR1 domain-containing protein 1
MGLSLAAYNIFLLPLDVANQRGGLNSGGEIPMSKVTLVFYIASVLIVIIGVPFTIFYYEGADDNDESDSKK